jgi:translation initiation factor eIF-2B subunit epsilon
MLVHPPSSRLLNYIQNPISPRRQRVAFPANLFLEPWPATIDEYEVWSGTSASSSLGGYRDLGIDICEADVPALCTENFDYHDLRRHFVNGVLTSELLGKYINVHLVGDQQSGGDVKDLKSKIQSGRYVERVRDTRSYGDTANDILRRWVFPLVPDVKLPGATDYELRRGNIYVSREHVLLSRTTTLVGPLLIGSRCDLDNNTTIQGSTLGANCKVGANTTISNSHIFGDARIGDKCVLTECIMGYGVTLGDNVTIGRGCLIGDGVKIESGVTIEDFARIGREKYRPDDYDSDDESDDDAEGKL